MTVTVVDYDPAWPARFAERRDAVQGVAGGRIVAIEHFGSTSVPGLAAKPVIDIVVAVREFDEDGAALADAVRPLGYVPLDTGMPGRSLLVRDVDGVRVEHLHVVPLDRWDLMKERLLRDWLLTHPADRDRYGAEARPGRAGHGRRRVHAGQDGADPGARGRGAGGSRAAQ